MTRRARLHDVSVRWCWFGLLGLEGEAADLGERVGQFAAAEERFSPGIGGAPVGVEDLADQAPVAVAVFDALLAGGLDAFGERVARRVARCVQIAGVVDQAPDHFVALAVHPSFITILHQPAPLPVPPRAGLPRSR